jgi:hypothetical protein
LKPDDAIPVQNTANTPLFITVADGFAQGVVGSLTKGSHSSSESSLKAPHPKRKERWEKLNEILEKLKSSDSTGYSYVKWNQVKDVLRTTPYTQSIKAIPDLQLSLLSQYLSFASKCFGPVRDGSYIT